MMKLIEILSKRMDCIDEIMQYKKEKGLPILQPEYFFQYQYPLT